MRFAVLLLLLLDGCGGTPPPPLGRGGAPAALAPPEVVPEDPDEDEVADEPCQGGETTSAGPAQVTGDLDRQVIQSVIKANMAAIIRCYDTLQKSHPDAEGKVVTKWTVEQDGTTSKVSASGVHPDLETCLVGLVRTFKFPPTPAGSGGIGISYPFVFKRSP